MMVFTHASEQNSHMDLCNLYSSYYDALYLHVELLISILVNGADWLMYEHKVAKWSNVFVIYKSKNKI